LLREGKRVEMPGGERFLEEGKRLVDAIAIAGFEFVFLTQFRL
jgi:hypothetical protein